MTNLKNKTIYGAKKVIISTAIAGIMLCASTTLTGCKKESAPVGYVNYADYNTLDKLMAMDLNILKLTQQQFTTEIDPYLENSNKKFYSQTFGKTFTNYEARRFNELMISVIEQREKGLALSYSDFVKNNVR
ncbi:MAG: hypothetical protein FWF34_00765 [Alphaproteobacteria bacterium]|nr:hypothetical protein [Alphaproteobacteria bacterium]MCL2889778.1 hypothetical protein [Alphaproteobacteria bacterium]